MADHVSMPLTGTGDATADVAVETINSEKHQKIRLNVGAAGADSTLVRGQQVAANSLPVVLASDQSAHPVDHSTTGTADGHKEVTTAGTRVVLAASTAAKWATIQAYRSNTGTIAVGGATVNASVTAGTGTGISLSAGESITLPCDNLNDINIDSTVNGEGVRYTYGT